MVGIKNVKNLVFLYSTTPHYLVSESKTKNGETLPEQTILTYIMWGPEENYREGCSGLEKNCDEIGLKGK